MDYISLFLTQIKTKTGVKKLLIKLYLLGFVIFISNTHVHSQLNSSFEDPIDFNTVNFIPNWNIWLDNANGMIDNSGAFEGMNGFCVEPIDNTTQYSVYGNMQIPLYIFDEGNISFSIKINTQQADVDSIFLEVGEERNTEYSSNIYNYTSVDEIDGWKSYTIPYQPSDKRVDAVRFIISVYAKSGYIQIDDFEINKDGKEIPMDKWRNSNDEKIVQELKNYMIPLDEFIASEALKRKSTIIGIGENSHGIEECKKLRYDIVTELRKTNHVNVLVEQSPIELAILNSMLTNKSEKVIKSQISALFWFYRSSYFFNLVKDSAVEDEFKYSTSFLGVDIQYENFNKGDLERNDVVLSKSEEIVIDRSIAARKKIKITNDLHFGRDSIMAQNTLTLFKEDSYNVLFAHNGHVRKKEQKLGTWIDKEMADQYVNIGVFTGRGSQRASDIHVDGVIRECPIAPILPKSYESIFDKVHNEPFVLDMKVIRSLPSIYENISPRAMTSSSAVCVISKFSHYILDITKEFDYIIYYPTVKAVTMMDNN